MSETPSLVPQSKVVWDSSGKIIEGGHNISLNDYVFMTNEATEQFHTLSGRIMQLVETLGLPEKQERAIKRYVKKEIWERCNDFESCMFSFSRTEYPSDMKPMGGMPVEEVE